eukprot:GHRR01018068.1.p1 GENE.GHRR01018068.1~~GHRR01018068.1.p1  ORF type:complete len:168 (+),score=41.06 GHRR01018068.1:162-665(+)
MSPVLYEILGLEVPWVADTSLRATEAGQLFIDRLRHYDVLEHLWFLKTHSNSGVQGADLGIVGKCLWGDKDTYLIAFHQAGKGNMFHTIPHMPLQALSQTRHDVFSHAGMVQRGLHGELLFLHRTAAGKLWPHCAVHGGKTCIIWGVTTLVDQGQLVASVQGDNDAA